MWICFSGDPRRSANFGLLRVRTDGIRLIVGRTLAALPLVYGRIYNKFKRDRQNPGSR